MVSSGIWRIREDCKHDEKSKISHDNYAYIVNKYFGDVLNNIEFDGTTLYGKTELHGLDATTIIRVKAKFNIGEDTFDDFIYFYVNERDAYYRIYGTKHIFLNYQDKSYDVFVDFGEFEYGTGIYTSTNDVYIYDKKDVDLTFSNLFAYRSGNSQNDVPDSHYFKVQLDSDKNLLSEVIKYFHKTSVPVRKMENP